MSQQHAAEVAQGDRFEFGKHWAAFLADLTDQKTADAKKSLAEMLEAGDLRGKRFLDIGSGSGLFSLAARRMGTRVHSFDYDPNSVGCTARVQQQYFAGDPEWTVEQGSVLDENYLKAPGEFDIVYCWGRSPPYRT